MNWQVLVKGFSGFLKLEKSLSANSVEAYLRDIEKLIQFLDYKKIDVTADKLELEHFREFLKWINHLQSCQNWDSHLLAIAYIYHLVLAHEYLNCHL